MTKPLRIGVLGAANIARAFVAGCAPSQRVHVAAVASRDGAKARAFAQETGVPRTHDTYEALLADPDIDAVYVPLPNGLHAPWSIRAVEAGKHVLCEKPLATSADEVRAMFAAAARRGVTLREAYPYLAQPYMRTLRDWIAGGAIGRLKLMRAHFSFRLDRPADVRLDPAIGGGALYDLGCYVISLARIVAGARPARARAHSILHERGVDLTTLATLEQADGALVDVTCSFAMAAHRTAAIYGEDGMIETNFLNHPPLAGPPVLRIRRGVTANIPFEDAEVEHANGFRLSAESFADLAQGASQDWAGASPQESLDIAMTIDAIRASSVSGRPESVG